jgi:hypothetical protein
MSVISGLGASEYENMKKALDAAIKEEGVTLTKEEYDIMLKELVEEKNEVAPNTSPDESWLNHTIEVKFDDTGGRNLRGKTKRLKILKYDVDSDGYTYFSVEDLTDRNVNTLYTFWFDNKNSKQELGPNIESYRFVK